MTDLCSLADVRAWLNTGTDAYQTRDDALLARLITAASAFIESWLARPIGLDNWQERRDGLGGQRLSRMVLAVTPVQSINTLAIMNNGAWQVIPPLPGFTEFPSLPPAGQVIPPTFTGPSWVQGYSFTPTEICLYGWRFWRGIQNVLIQYTAGYDPVPADIRQACIELVAFKYKQRTRIGVKTISIGGIETITYETSSFSFSMRDVSSDTQTLLWQYRQVAPIIGAVRMPKPSPSFVLEDVVTPIVEEDLVTPIVEET